MTNMSLKYYGSAFMDQDQLAVLHFQQALGLVQILCFILYYTVSVTPDYGSQWYQRNARYIVYTAVIVYSLVVPGVSIVHWIAYLKLNTSQENSLRAFTLIYPLIGVCNILQYFVFIKQIMSQIKQELQEARHVGWESFVDELMEVSWSAAIYQIHQPWEDSPQDRIRQIRAKSQDFRVLKSDNELKILRQLADGEAFD